MVRGEPVRNSVLVYFARAESLMVDRAAVCGLAGLSEKRQWRNPNCDAVIIRFSGDGPGQNVAPWIDCGMRSADSFVRNSPKKRLA